MLRKLLIFLEVIGAATAVIAFYEIFLTPKTVSSVSTEIDLCGVNALDENVLSLASFVEDNKDEFLYLDLQIKHLGWEFSNHCKSDPMDIIEFDLSDERNGVLYLPPSRFPAIQKAQTAWVNNRLHFDLPQIEGSVLAHYYEDHFGGSITIEGLFFSDFDMHGESGFNFKMIPAPFDTETQLLSSCTKATKDSNIAAYFWAYLTHCVL